MDYNNIKDLKSLLDSDELLLMIDDGWDINAVDNKKNTLLHYACYSKPKLCSFLLENGAESSLHFINNTDQMPSDIILRKIGNGDGDFEDHIKLLDVMKNYGCHFDYNNNSHLIELLSFFDQLDLDEKESIYLLIGETIHNKIDETGNHLIQGLISQNNINPVNLIDTINWFIDCKWDINYTNSKNENILHTILSEEIEISSFGTENIIDISQLLIKNGINLKTKDIDENNYLHLCCFIENFEFVDYFINLGLNPNDCNKYHKNSLEIAIEFNQKAIVHIIPHIKDLNKIDSNGNNYLHQFLSLNPENDEETLTSLSCLIEGLGENFNFKVKNSDGETIFDLIQNRPEQKKIINQYYQHQQLKNNYPKTEQKKRKLAL